MANFSDVFISYSRRNKEFARRLFDSLKMSGRESWADWEDIPFSVDWWNEIRAGIDSARIFVFIVTPDSLRSEVCNRELSHAIINHKRIVPVIHQDVIEQELAVHWYEKPWEMMARDNWTEVQRLNWLFFRDADDFDKSFADLTRIIEEDPEQVRMHTWLLVRARDWDENGRGASRLLTGQEIPEAQAWLEEALERPPHPTELHKEYIAESRKIEENRLRLLRNLRRATIGLATVGLLAIFATIFSLIQANRAQDQADEAQNQVVEARSNLTEVGVQLAQVNVTLDVARNAQEAAQALAATAQSNAATATVVQGQAQQQVTQAQQELGAANTLVAVAGTDAALLGATLTPIPATLQFANEQVTEAAILAEEAQQRADEAELQVAEAQDELTRIPPTLTQVNNARVTAEAAAAEGATEAAAILANAQRELATATAQIADSDRQAATAQVAAGTAGAQAATAQLQATAAQDQAATAQAQATTAQQQAQSAQDAAANAQTQAAVIQEQAAQAQTQSAEDLAQANAVLATATQQIGDSQRQAATAQAQATAAQQQAQSAQAAAATAEAQAALALTQSAAEVTRAAEVLANAQNELATATVQIAESDRQAAAAQGLATIAAQEAATAQGQAATAQQALAQSEQEATQAARVLANAENELATATVQIADSQQQANIALETAAAAQDQAIAAQGEAAAARDEAVAAQELAALAQEDAQAAQAQATVAQAQAYVAETQVAQARNDLTQIAPTLTEAAEAVGEALAEAEIYQSQAVEAQTQAERAQSTLVAVDGQARSQALAVNAQQAISNNNYDLAVALLLESSRLNPDLTLTQRLLSQTVYNTARLSFDDNTDARFRPGLTPPAAHIAESSGSVIQIHDMATRQVIYRMEGHTGTINAIDFSPDGMLLASASEDGSVILWDVSGDAAVMLAQFTDHNAPVNDLQFTPDGSRFASVGDDNRAMLWDVASLALNSVYSPATGRVMTRVQFNANGQRFFTWEQAGPDEVIRQWGVGQNSEIWSSLNAQTYRQFSADLRLAVDDVENALVVWNVQNQIPERQFTTGFSFDVERATQKALRPTGGDVLVYVTRTDGGSSRLVLLDIATQGIEGEFSGSAVSNVTALAFNPDGDRMLSGAGRSLVMWDVERGQAIQEFFAHNDTITEIVFNNDGTYALSRSRDGNVRVWDVTLEDPNTIGRITAPVNQFARVNSPGFNPAGTSVYGAVWIDVIGWGVGDMAQSQRLTIGNEIIRMLYSPVEPLAVVVSANNASVWDLSQPASNARRDFLGTGSESYTGIGAISADGQWVVLDTNANALVLRSLTNERIQVFDKSIIQSPDITALSITPDNQFIIAATGELSEDDPFPGPILIWEIATGEMVRELDTSLHTRTIKSLDVSADGTKLLTASADGSLVIWNLETGRFLQRLSAHTAPVNVGLFSPDNETVFSASDDGRIMQWSIESGQFIRIYSGHSLPVTGLSIRADGSVFASTTGVDNEPMIVWTVDTLEELVEWTLANRYVYQLTCDEQRQFDIQSEACGTLIASGGD